MARVVWSEPALADLDAIADYIALDNPDTARSLVTRVFAHVGHLRKFPASGSRPSEFPRSRYRQIVEPSCRVFYRMHRKTILIVHVMRSEQKLRPTRLT